MEIKILISLIVFVIWFILHSIAEPLKYRKGFDKYWRADVKAFILCLILFALLTWL